MIDPGIGSILMVAVGAGYMMALWSRKLKPCKWGRCNGTYVPGGRCSRCGTAWH